MGTTMTLDMNYESLKGGIATKSDVGTMIYDTPGKPYALGHIDPSTGLTPGSEQSFSYTSFESVSTITENGYAAALTQSNTTTYYNLLRDYLGNITHVLDATNNSVIEEYSFDAWGRMRNPATWENYALGSEPVLFIAGRGFTGHEHLPWFNLINMNGRVYDPLLGMFLSPDNYVQNPGLTQNFNRYGLSLIH